MERPLGLFPLFGKCLVPGYEPLTLTLFSLTYIDEPT